MSYGIGEVFKAGGEVAKALGNAKFIVQAAAHGVSQGVLSVMQGGDFLSGAVAGEWGSSFGGDVFFGALSGGIGAELTGGNFWQGAVTGGIVAGLNHAMHMERLATDSNPPEEEGWQIKIANLISGGAVDEARAILEIDKMYAPGSIEKIGAMMSISLRNATNVTFGARGISGWGNNIGKLGGINRGVIKNVNIKASSVKGYSLKGNIGNKYTVYGKTVNAKNLSGQASAKYYKIFNNNGKMIKMYKDSYRIDGRFYHRRVITPEFNGVPRYSK